MDRDFIDYNQIRPEFRDNWQVNIILAFHNVCAWYCNECEDCCAHDRDIDCSSCHIGEIGHKIEKDLNKYAEAIEKNYPELTGKLLKHSLDNCYCDPELRSLTVSKSKSPEFFDAATAKKEVERIRKSEIEKDLNYVYSKISEGVKKGCNVINIDLKLNSNTSDLIKFLENKGFEVSLFTGTQLDPCSQLVVKFK